MERRPQQAAYATVTAEEGVDALELAADGTLIRPTPAKRSLQRAA
jgi:hypothetical protein